VDICQKTLDDIIGKACELLNAPYDSRSFNCLHFVRVVYAEMNLSLPPLRMNPGLDNLRSGSVPSGYILYLKHKRDDTDRRFTHAAIVMENKKVIHCSYYFGEKVVISDIDEILSLYELADPAS
jgi:hypothetical protein